MFLWLLTFYQTGPNGLFILYQVFNLILQSAELIFSLTFINFPPRYLTVYMFIVTNLANFGKR